MEFEIVIPQKALNYLLVNSVELKQCLYVAHKDNEEDVKVAKVIAAAPKMLDRLEQIYHDITIEDGDTWEDLKNMLEKARSLALSAIKTATT